MKNRTRKKQLAKQFTSSRKLPAQFVNDTFRGKAEAEAGQLMPYRFTVEDRAWLDMKPVGREFGSSDGQVAALP
jgi:hypothetical protein